MIAPRFWLRPALKTAPIERRARVVSMYQQFMTARSVPEPDPGPCPPACFTDTDPGAAGLTYFDDNLP
jgi:hypothetical protein